MIVEERLTTYLHSLESADIPVLDEIGQEARTWFRSSAKRQKVF